MLVVTFPFALKEIPMCEMCCQCGWWMELDEMSEGGVCVHCECASFQEDLEEFRCHRCGGIIACNSGCDADPPLDI